MTSDKLYSIRTFEEIESEHLAYFTNHLSNEINLLEKVINLQSDLLNGYLTIFHVYPHSSTDSVVLQAHVKSIYLLYNAHKLTLQGNYGIAKSLFRQIFEFQLICKYFSLINNDDEAQKWLDKRQLDVYNKILKRLEKPSKENLFDFWKLLCTQAHATTTSCQVASNIDINRNEIRMVYYMILLCIEGYSLGYLGKRKNMLLLKTLIGNELYDEFVTFKYDLKEAIAQITALLSNDGIALIKDYKTNWTFR